MNAGETKSANVQFTDNFGNPVVPTGSVEWSGSNDLAISVVQHPTVPTAASVTSLGQAGTFTIQATTGDVTVQETLVVNAGPLVNGQITFGS